MPALSPARVTNLSNVLSAGSKAKVPNAYGGGIAISGLVELERKLTRVGETATDKRLVRNTFKKSLDGVVEPAKKRYRSNFPGRNHGHKMTVWHYGKGRYPPRGSGAETIRAGIDNRGVYLGAGGLNRAGKYRADMRGKEKGRGRHPLKPKPDSPRKDWLWFPIDRRPFLQPTIDEHKTEVARDYARMVGARARTFGLDTHIG